MKVSGENAFGSHFSLLEYLFVNFYLHTFLHSGAEPSLGL